MSKQELEFLRIARRQWENRISALESALAQMTTERDGLKTELHDLGKQLDIEFRGLAAAEAKLEAVEKVLAQWRGQKWIYTRGEVIRRTCIEEIEGALKGE